MRAEKPARRIPSPPPGLRLLTRGFALRRLARVKSPSSFVILALLACAGARAALPASRFDEFTKKFARTADRAEIITSTYVGSAGTEWLAGGGFQPDGTLVVAGTSLGPTLDLGTPATVLGTDGAIQAPFRRPVLGRFGRPEMDKDQKPKLEPLGWDHPNATAFIARLSPDAKSIQSVTRFGWKCGGLTGAAVDGEGSIYVCGPASPTTAGISADAKELEPGVNAARGSGHGYLAKLSPDGAKALWVRTSKGAGGAPRVSLDKAGRIHLRGQDLRVLDSSGRQLSATALPGGAEGHVAVNPVDGTIARGGEHHWPTGREPYRDPTLNIFKPDGSLLYELYNWDGPFVGLNSLRMVSDSAIRGVAYDDDGNLLVHAWSDGGNSVMYREPNDIFTASKKMDGLGFSAWGAGVLSCAYLIRIETKNYTVAAGALWVGYLGDRNKPNSVMINSLGLARDGSVCVAGSSAWGLIRTGNAFPGDPTGDYVAVMSRDLTSLRFCSTLPGTGQTAINDSARWAVASGTVNGKTMALFVSGAMEREGGGTPVLNARQEKHAGGLSDGHLLLLDLSAGSTR